MKVPSNKSVSLACRFGFRIKKSGFLLLVLRINNEKYYSLISSVDLEYSPGPYTEEPLISAQREGVVCPSRLMIPSFNDNSRSDSGGAEETPS